MSQPSERREHVTVYVVVACADHPEHFEITVRYAGHPDAGSAVGVFQDGDPPETCPVCDADTEVER